MAIPWLAIILSIIVLISVLTVLGIVLYKNKIKRLRQTTKIKKSVTKDVEVGKAEPTNRISTPPFKDKVEPMPKGNYAICAIIQRKPYLGQFVRPCHVSVTKSISNISQSSLPSLRTYTPPASTVIPLSTPTELCAPVSLIDRRSSATSATAMIEQQLMQIGPPPKDFISELDERERQKRKYKSSPIF